MLELNEDGNYVPELDEDGSGVPELDEDVVADEFLLVINAGDSTTSVLLEWNEEGRLRPELGKGVGADDLLRGINAEGSTIDTDLERVRWEACLFGAVSTSNTDPCRFLCFS